MNLPHSLLILRYNRGAYFKRLNGNVMKTYTKVGQRMLFSIEKWIKPNFDFCIINIHMYSCRYFIA